MSQKPTDRVRRHLLKSTAVVTAASGVGLRFGPAQAAELLKQDAKDQDNPDQKYQAIGVGRDRGDGSLKITGQATYAIEHQLDTVVYGVVIQSTIPPLTLGWQRFVGTAFGAVVGAAIATFFHPSAAIYAVGIVLCGLLAHSLRVGGAYRFAAITLSIVLLIPRVRGPWVTAWHRFLEVSLGIAVALLVTVVWPLKRKS